MLLLNPDDQNTKAQIKRIISANNHHINNAKDAITTRINRLENFDQKKISSADTHEIFNIMHSLSNCRYINVERGLAVNILHQNKDFENDSFLRKAKVHFQNSILVKANVPPRISLEASLECLNKIYEYDPRKLGLDLDYP